MQRQAEEILARHYGQPGKALKAMEALTEEYLRAHPGPPPAWCNAQNLLELADYRIFLAHSTKSHVNTKRRYPFAR
jgi:hypothetical protein